MTSTRPTEAEGAHDLPPHFATSIGFLLNKAAQLLLDDFENALAPYELSAREFGVLRYIDVNGGQSQQRIGANLRIDRTTMVTIVDRLERAGYLLRTRDLEDRRRYAVTLAEEGQQWFRSQLAAIEREVTDSFLEGIDEQDRRKLVDILIALVSNAEERTTE